MTTQKLRKVSSLTSAFANNLLEVGSLLVLGSTLCHKFQYLDGLYVYSQYCDCLCSWNLQRGFFWGVTGVLMWGLNCKCSPASKHGSTSRFVQMPSAVFDLP